MLKWAVDWAERGVRCATPDPVCTTRCQSSLGSLGDGIRSVAMEAWQQHGRSVVVGTLSIDIVASRLGGGVEDPNTHSDTCGSSIGERPILAELGMAMMLMMMMSGGCSGNSGTSPSDSVDEPGHFKLLESLSWSCRS